MNVDLLPPEGGRASRGWTFTLIAIALLALGAAIDLAISSRRTSSRSEAHGAAAAAWAQEMAEHQTTMPTFLPLAREAIAADRRTLGAESPAVAGTLLAFLFMAERAHFEFGHKQPAPAVEAFKREVVDELADVELRLLAREAPEAIGFIKVFTDTEECALVAGDRCARVQLGAGRLVASRLQGGDKALASTAGALGDRLNDRAWAAARDINGSKDDYATALTQADTAALLEPDDADVFNTLAMARCRAGDLPAASQAIDHAIRLRPDHEADTSDLAVRAVIEARRGQKAQAGATLAVIEQRRAAMTAAAATQKEQAAFDPQISKLVSEARVVLGGS